MGGHRINIRGLYKGDGIQGRGQVTKSVVKIYGCGMTAEDYDNRDFGGSVGAAATVICQAW